MMIHNNEQFKILLEVQLFLRMRARTRLSRLAIVGECPLPPSPPHPTTTTAARAHLPRYCRLSAGFHRPMYCRSRGHHLRRRGSPTDRGTRGSVQAGFWIMHAAADGTAALVTPSVHPLHAHTSPTSPPPPHRPLRPTYPNHPRTPPVLDHSTSAKVCLVMLRAAIHIYARVHPRASSDLVLILPLLQLHLHIFMLWLVSPQTHQGLYGPQWSIE